MPVTPGLSIIPGSFEPVVAPKMPETLLQTSLWMSLWMLLHLFGHPVLATGTSVSGGFCGEDSQLHYAEFAEFVSGPFF